MRCRAEASVCFITWPAPAICITLYTAFILVTHAVEGISKERLTTVDICRMFFMPMFQSVKCEVLTMLCSTSCCQQLFKDLLWL